MDQAHFVLTWASVQAAVCVEGTLADCSGSSSSCPKTLHHVTQASQITNLACSSLLGLSFLICEVELWQEQRCPSQRPACPDTRSARQTGALLPGGLRGESGKPVSAENALMPLFL